MESIYEQLNKINDEESLNEKYDVRTLKDVKKLHESSSEYTVEDAIEFAREHVLYNNNYNDYDFNSEGDNLSITIWTENEYGDEVEKIFNMKISRLFELVDDEDAFAAYIDSCEDSVNYEALGDDFYRRAEEELNKHFNCTGAHLEPSTQLGQGKTFLFADDMSFDGSFDFQTGEDYISQNNFDGFLELCISSFTPVIDEDVDNEVVEINKPITESYATREFEIPNFNAEIIDEFEDDGIKGYNIVYSKNGTDIVEVEVWETNSPVAVNRNLHTPHLMQSYYSSFDEFASDLEYKTSRYVCESADKKPIQKYKTIRGTARSMNFKKLSEAQSSTQANANKN